MEWLYTSFKATTDNGCAQAYFLSDNSWRPSYPETTGYIIPTFYDYAALIGDSAWRDLATRMALWECDVQMESGAVRAGTMGPKNEPRPTIFNTGQVLFGWARAFEETGQEAFGESLDRAASWLCDVQDADGCWRRYGSTKTTTSSVNTYNTRTAWGLIEAHRVTEKARFRDAARRNCEWARTQQKGNGWWRNNCLQDNSRPFTHTIAYAMRGFLEVGAFLKEERFIDAAVKAARKLLRCQRPDGSWAGQYNQWWWPKAKWSCLTGNSQLAVNFIRLFEITGERKFFESAVKANRFNMAVQDTKAEDPNIRGGIAGSWPIDGGYHPNQYPNWAAKFFADSLMAEIRHQP